MFSGVSWNQPVCPVHVSVCLQNTSVKSHLVTDLVFLLFLFFDRSENIVGKRENCGQKASYLGLLKLGVVR